MKSVSAAYTSAILDYGREFQNEVIITDGTNTETYTNAEITIEEYFSKDDSLSMGAYFSNEAKIKLYEPTNSVSYSNCSFTINSKLLVNGSYESVAMGIFYPSEVKNNDGSIEITAYDMMSRLEDDYEPTVTFPSTDTLILADICTQKSLTLATGTAGAGTTIESLYEGTIAEQLAWLAGLQGKNAIFNEEGKLEFRWYNNLSMAIQRTYQVENGLSLDESSFTIASITSGTSENPLTAGSGKGITFENPYMTQTILNSIWSNLSNKTYYTGSVETFGMPQFEVGDMFSVFDKSNQLRLFALSHNTWTFNGGCHCVSVSVGSPDAEVEFSTESPTEKKISKFKYYIQEIKGALSNIINTTTGIFSIETNSSGVTTGWKIVDNAANPQNIVRATLGGIGISSDGGQTYSNAITGEGIVASSITSGKITAEQLDITGTANFYEGEIPAENKLYGIKLMEQGGNLFSLTNGYAPVVNTFAYQCSGSYTKYEFAETIGGTKTDVTEDIITYGSGVFYAGYGDGYLYITGADSTSDVRVVSGFAISVGYQDTSTEEFVHQADITTDGQAWFQGINCDGGIGVYNDVTNDSTYISAGDEVSGKTVTDTVSCKVGSSTQGSMYWYYRTMGNYKYELWGQANLGSATFSSAYGTYRSPQFTIPLPILFSFFTKSFQDVQLTAYSSSGDVYSASCSGMTTSGNITGYAYSGTSGSHTLIVNVHAILFSS